MVPALEIVEERPEFRISKISAELSNTPRSNIEAKSNEETERREMEQ